MTSGTRVSLDFRLILGPNYDALSCGGGLPGGQRDVYRSGGFFSKYVRRAGGEWGREGDLLPPDARTGFPWTVTDWAKWERKQKKPQASSITQ